MAGGFLRNPLILFLAALLGAHGASDWLAYGAEAKALAPGAKPAAASAQWNELDRAVGREEYAKAKKLADGILQRGSADDREKVMAVYGRILLGLGEKESARQYLAMLVKRETGGIAKDTAKIYAAWLQALDGKSDEAIKALEQIAKSKSPTRTTAEAADVLAMLHMARGERDKARKAVDAGIQSLKYLSVKDGYVHALLRGRLNSNLYAGEAEKLYDAAEKLRKQGKFAEAGKGFFEVRSKFPESQWAHPAGFHIGQCFIGIGRPTDAASHWEKFIQEAPAGPWRGQAHVAMVDLMLQSRADMAQAAAHAMTASAALDKPLDKDAEASWQQAAYDIRIRQGIVSLVEGRFDAAIQAFQQAKKSDAKGDAKPAGPSPEALAGLDHLIEAAKNREKLIPEELSVGDDRAAMMLRVGVAYHVLRQPDRAEIYFNLLLGGPTRSSSAAHRSFAHYGLSLVRGSTAAGKTACEASLKEYPQASFHDETLYRMATVIEAMAEAKYAPANETEPGRAASDPLKTETARRAALAKAKGEAQPHWQKIVKDYPHSPRSEQAFYRAGVRLCDLAAATPAEKSEQAWKEAGSTLYRFCESYPKSLYSGDAYVRQIDLALERMFDLKVAQSLSARSLQWANGIDRETVPAAGMPIWRMPSPEPDSASLNASVYACYLRAGLVAYFSGQKEEAVAMFRKADALDDSPRKRVGAETAMMRMIAVAEGTRAQLAPQAFLDSLKDERQKTAILLADLALLTFDPERAGRVYEQFLAGNTSLPKPTTEVESYLILRLGQALEFQWKHDEAMACLKRLYDPKYANYPWAADGIFRVGTWTHNATQDIDAGMKDWEHVFTKHPKHPEAERSLFYYGLSAMEGKDFEKATAAFSEYLRRYPDSRWTRRVKNELLPDVKERAQKQKEKRK